MRVVVTAEARLLATPDGAVWTNGGSPYGYWTRYLSAFDEIRLVARVCEVDRPPPAAERVDGAGVQVWRLPYYVGPVQYLVRRAAVRQAARAAVGDTDAVILRVPSPIGGLLAGMLARERRPYALEVVGDPYDVFAPGAVSHPLRPVLRRWFPALLQDQCRRAAAVAYVTAGHLQARYPAAPDAVTAHFAGVHLPPAAFVAEPPPLPGRGGPFHLISVGSLEQPYKGVDTSIRALAALVAEGLDVRLVHVGDGRLRSRLAQLADRLAVADRVTFTGALPAGAPVRRRLDEAHLFLMPSRTEGLPRALVEAMARGLPAVGSTAGGIPELLPPEHLVPPDDPVALATAVRALLTDPHRMAAAADRNLRRARTYASSALMPRRAAYYRAVRATAEAPATAVRDTDRPPLARRLADRVLPGPPQVPAHRPRVVRVLGSLDVGGCELRTLELMPQLLSAGVELHIVALSGRVGTLAPRARLLGAHVHPMPLGFDFPVRFVRLLRRLRATVVHSDVATFSGAIVALAALAGVPARIAHFRSDGDGRPDSPRRRLQRWLMRGLIVCFATDVLAVSPGALRHGYARDSVPGPRCRVVPNGLDLERLRAPAATDLRARVGAGPDEVLLLHVGRPAREKRRALLPAVVAALGAAGVPAHAVLVGPHGADDD
ncbi:MAG TPA: glycosyltransferase, partial [Pilimelia sp.]|nr:glycosyltransferase [Pilimelia sp.]